MATGFNLAHNFSFIIIAIAKPGFFLANKIKQIGILERLLVFFIQSEHLHRGIGTKIDFIGERNYAPDFETSPDREQ